MEANSFLTGLDEGGAERNDFAVLHGHISDGIEKLNPVL
jgi:hypothetical protein